MMNGRILPLLAIATFARVAHADTYVIDRNHSEVGFRVRHLMSKVPGRFLDFDGTVEADGQKPERSSVRFVIQAKSIDTANAQRDQHLRSPDFFDVDRYPTITFESRAVRRLDADRFEVVGSLSLRGVTKELTLPVAFLGFVRDPWGAERAGFEISARLNRKDFGIVWNQTLDAGGLLLGDEVEITINVEAVKRKPATTQ